MAFKKFPKHREQIELVSLIDIIFILLIFFMVTSYVIQTPLQERGLYVPTPENRLGRAQILLQLIDEDRVLWLDESASEEVQQVEEEFGYLSPPRLRSRILDMLIERYTIPYDALPIRIESLRRRADSQPGSRFFVLLRSPDRMPFWRIVDIVADLSNNSYHNIKYGCVGGTLNDLQRAQSIRVVNERDSNGQLRKNLMFVF